MTDFENDLTEQTSALDSPTPLGAILGKDEVVAPSPPSQGEAPDDLSLDRADEHVPLAALRRERERRKKMDARVQELEEEINKYNEQKWGLDEDTSGAESETPENDAFLNEYSKSYAGFVSKHGKERVAEVDAALVRLSPEQRNEVLNIVAAGGNCVERVHDYIEHLGLIAKTFAPTTIKDALSGKRDGDQTSNQPNPAQLDELAAREQHIAALEQRTRFLSSRTEFISEHGRQRYVDLDAAATRFVQSGHPAAAQFIDVVTQQGNPVGAVVDVLTHFGFWPPQDAAYEQHQQTPRIMPSNFAGMRSVGVRSGPTFGGPTPLKDIFARSA